MSSRSFGSGWRRKQFFNAVRGRHSILSFCLDDLVHFVSSINHACRSPSKRRYNQVVLTIISVGGPAEHGIFWRIHYYYASDCDMNSNRRRKMKCMNACDGAVDKSFWINLICFHRWRWPWWLSAAAAADTDTGTTNGILANFLQTLFFSHRDALHPYVSRVSHIRDAFKRMIKFVRRTKKSGRKEWYIARKTIFYGIEFQFLFALSHSIHF